MNCADKVTQNDLCSTDSGTSYSSAVSSKGGTEWSDLSDAADDAHCTDLNYFHEHAEFSNVISKGTFVKMSDIATCCRGEGKVELHSMMQRTHASLVVVKRLPLSRANINKGKPGNERDWHHDRILRDAEDPLAELGVFSYLSKLTDLPSYILKMHAAFQADDEMWLVLENADEGDLFSVVKTSKPNDRQIKHWMWQLLHAVKYLHQHHIGHRDISLENVLLCQGAVRLMDFGQAVRSHSASGQILRYFIAAGKPYYRAPETYIPKQKSIQVIVPPELPPCQPALLQTPQKDFLCHVRLPDFATPGQLCSAEPWGYTVQQIDVFAVAVCMVITKLGSPPWREARPNDGHFKWAQANGISALAKAWQKPLPPGMDDLLSLMLQVDPQARPTVADCLADDWFGTLRDTAVATHQESMQSAATDFPEEDPMLMMRSVGDIYYSDPDLICRGDSSTYVESTMHQDLGIGACGDPYTELEDSMFSTLLGGAETRGCELLEGVPGLLPLIRDVCTGDIK